MKGYTKCRFTDKQLLKPGLKLIGAKCNLKDLLYQLMLPSHEVYVEPFVGSTAVVTGKAPSPVEIIGDTNDYLFNYFLTLRHKPEVFWDLYEKELELLHAGGKARFIEIRDKVTLEHDKDLQAVWFFLITKVCYNGIWRLNNETGLCNSSYCKQTHGRGWFTREQFDAVLKRYENLIFINKSYRQTLEFVLSFKGDKFYFFDPPYRQRDKDNGAGTVTTYNGQVFTDEDMVDLKEELWRLPGHFLMTINDDEWTRLLFKGFYQVQHNVRYQCSQTNAGRGPHPELLVASYPIAEKYNECMELIKSKVDAKTQKAKSGTRKRRSASAGVGECLDTSSDQ